MTESLLPRINVYLALLSSASRLESIEQLLPSRAVIETESERGHAFYISLEQERSGSASAVLRAALERFGHSIKLLDNDPSTENCILGLVIDFENATHGCEFEIGSALAAQLLDIGVALDVDIQGWD